PGQAARGEPAHRQRDLRDSCPVGRQDPVGWRHRQAHPDPALRVAKDDARLRRGGSRDRESTTLLTEPDDFPTDSDDFRADCDDFVTSVDVFLTSFDLFPTSFDDFLEYSTDSDTSGSE